MPIDKRLAGALPIFNGFTREELDGVLADARSRHYAKNEMIFEQGAKAVSFFVLLHGRVRAYRLTPDGQQIVMRFVGPGELFGIATAIGSPVYPANAAAVVDSVILSWPAPVWQALAARYPALALNTMHTIGSRLQEAHTRMTEMATEDVTRRIAHTLLRLANQAGRRTDSGVLIDFPISRQISPKCRGRRCTR